MLDRRRVLIYSDPLQHVLIAAAVVAPLAPSAGRRPGRCQTGFA